MSSVSDSAQRHEIRHIKRVMAIVAGIPKNDWKPSDTVLLMSIVFHINTENMCIINDSTLSGRSGIKPVEMKRSAERLIAKGLISRVPGGYLVDINAIRLASKFTCLDIWRSSEEL